jgi:hypothetical protein
VKLKITPTDVIENRGGKFSMAKGPIATECLRLRTIVQGLRLEQKTNGKMRLTRGHSCRAIAKHETGLKTNDYAKLITAIEVKLSSKLEECLIVDEEDNNTGA